MVLIGFIGFDGIIAAESRFNHNFSHFRSLKKMNLRERIAIRLEPTMRTEEEVRGLVKDVVAQEGSKIEALVKTEVEKAKMSLPIVANWDPKNEGYRRMSGDVTQRRDLAMIKQDRMFEIAYYMWDQSAMTKRLAKMDKTFLFAEPITVTSDDEAVKEIIDRFWSDPQNNMDLDFPDQMMWLGLLGEQCWPVDINKHNGHVRLGYVDPAGIREVYVNRMNVKQAVQVELVGTAGRSGKKMSVIRTDGDPRHKSFNRLVGECFFFAINKPPNSPRGRSDLLTLFDWIDGLEQYGFNYLERAEFLLNFVWDITLKGMSEDQIRKWMEDNPPPQPGSQRAHNEQVEWKAVSPDIKAHDYSKGFEMGKSFIMGAAGRPESWFGGGGKAYQTEAEIFGQVPIKDLDERQLYVRHVLNKVIQFQLDSAVIVGRLTEKQAAAGFTVNMPEISKKDLVKLVNGVPQLTTALTVAEQNRWITRETATRMFAMVSSQLGMEIDVEKELEAAGKALPSAFEDYEQVK